MQKFYIVLFIFTFLFIDISASERNDAVTGFGDPAFHFILSGYISGTSNLLIATVKPEWPAIARYSVSGAVSLIPGLGKEIYDAQYAGKQFDWIDITFDVSGIITGLVLYYLVFDRPKKNQMAHISYSHHVIQLNYAYRF